MPEEIEESELESLRKRVDPVPGDWADREALVQMMEWVAKSPSVRSVSVSPSVTAPGHPTPKDILTNYKKDRAYGPMWEVEIAIQYEGEYADRLSFRVMDRTIAGAWQYVRAKMLEAVT